MWEPKELGDGWTKQREKTLVVIRCRVDKYDKNVKLEGL